MNPQRRQRLAIVTGLVALAAIAIGLTLYALRANVDLFFTPQQIAAGDAPLGRSLRAGGVVRFDSVRRDPERVAVSFVVTDFVDDIKVHYQGILPDLFREGQGVVVAGTLEPNGVIEASQVLAKHDENYTPPEVVGALAAGGKLPPAYRMQLDAGLAPQAIESAAKVSGLDARLDAGG